MSAINRYIALVDAGIQRLGVDPRDCRTDEPNKWFMHRGDTSFVLFVRESMLYNESKRYVLVATCPMIIVPIEPQQRMRLLEYLLDCNHKLISEVFSVSEGIVYLSASYYLDEMREEEVATMIDALSYYGHAFFAEFRAMFPPPQA